MRGRLPTPAATKLLTGNPGHRPIGEDEVYLPAAAPVPPAYLSEAGRAHWDARVADLVTVGLIAGVDGDTFALFCEALALYAEAKQSIKESGLLVKTPSGYPIQNPYLAIMNRAADDIRRYADAFGLNPAARARLRHPGVQGALFPDDDPMEAYLRLNESLPPDERTARAGAAPAH